ncbi:MAG: ABC transporter ATP-binding protein [Desulfobacterales bacterium]|nr:ABC transporter ATP-binding protein [Desulfobacterales bacterium]
MNNILEARDLNITLLKNKNLIVKNVSFNVGKGKVLGIVGESGSGKTLTCKAIMKLLNKKIFALSGRVKLKGDDILQMSERQVKTIIGKDISMIMQNPMTAFDPMMKIGNQIVETIRAHTSLSKKQAYAMGVCKLEEMNLNRVSEMMNSYPHTLSGGMLQRIMIAISLLLEPSVIIADEATTALDVKTQSIILDEFKRIRDSGIGLIVVTHDFGVIAKIADDVIVMKGGRIVESGTVHQIFYNPKVKYTKALLNARFLVDEASYA